MPNARGDRAKLFSRRQTTFGTAESAGAGAFYTLPFYSYNVTPSGELSNDEAIRGDSFPGDAVHGLRNLAGALVVPMGLDSIGWWLAQLLGLPTTTGTGPYTHAFVAAANPGILLATHGITHNDLSTHFTQDSLAAQSIEITGAKNGQRQRVTLNMVGREEIKAGTTLDTSPVAFADDPVPVGFQGLLSIDGSEAAGVTQANLTLATGREADQEAMNGLATASDIQPGMWDLSGSLTARFRDTGLYDAASAGTAIALSLAWQISANYSLTIALPSVTLERTGIPIEGRDVISSSFNWRANRPATGDELIEVTLINATSDYANAS
ncbi:phage tail tube protein [Salipiger sp. 1_MG-2023]|uniref:phage tail tube protein n=1 Tax=Salipiger sp. 1_MG-2023 TaxID=3062665 RepID=UPI0026E369DB|nr:phage tail tube protein [Salipiger sp. 1_MG-2023]MDO6587701.1 phage tail tube protein [Salipiger sp. 1_MG-2023]